MNGSVLDQTLKWTAASGDARTMLDNLQPNILKGHIRDVLSLLFLRFESPDGGQAFLGELCATQMKSAFIHLTEVAAFKASEGAQKGTPYVGMGLTALGYEALGITNIPPDPSFQAGMRAADLNDPVVGKWQEEFREIIHAVVLVGDGDEAGQPHALAQVKTLLAAHPGITIVLEQPGLALRNENNEGIEHFGYVDGRSQPLFLDEDIEEETETTDGTSNWDPAAPLRQVIVPDSAAPDPAVHFGSYFIFRKLEQDVKKFKQAELDLASRLNLDDAERAGAMVVGRFEDGTPATTQFKDGVESPVPNDFTYSSDRFGSKCPFAGHIRKTNPRGSGGFDVPPEQERLHLMARRGQTYGKRDDDPNDGVVENKPKGGVGLLFMAFNSNIRQQFEFTQSKWANDPNFPQAPDGHGPPGVDPVIGQTPGDDDRPTSEFAVKWGKPDTRTERDQVPRAVTMRGGEYFFMPSLAFLCSLSPSKPSGA